MFSKILLNDMKKSTFRVFFLLFAVVLILSACKKSDKNTNPPIIELVSETGIISADTSAVIAQPLKFKVHCKWNGDNALTNFIVSSNGTRVLDEGMYMQEFDRDVIFAKDSSDVELVVFTIRDIKGGSASVSLRVTRENGTIGGELVRYSNIVLDAQGIENGKSFLSLTNGVTYTLQDAYGIQNEIHLLYFYDPEGDYNTISSPGANITISYLPSNYDIPNWNTRTTCRFVQVALTQEEFDAISEPASVVGLYTNDGKRKAKNLKAGDTYSFIIEDIGKYGVLRVSDVTGQESGQVTFSVVVQK